MMREKCTLREIEYIMNGTLNKVMLIGRLGNEIKMYYFDGGNRIEVSIGNHEVYINKTTNEKSLLPSTWLCTKRRNFQEKHLKRR
jgi:hypothetical protein